MYNQLKLNQLKLPLNVPVRKAQSPTKQHNQRVMQELRDALLSRFALRSMETRYLLHLIAEDEHIEGAVFGYQEVGFSMLVATNRRVLFLDCKPLFTNTDEVHYGVVSGINNNHAAFGTTIVLHTRVKNYNMFTFNRPSAKKFVSSIEYHCMDEGE